MAAILEVLLNREVTPDVVVSWLKNHSPSINTPHPLKDFSNLHQEFVPFFLNYLRDQTLHLLQSSRSANPSPAKTPSAQKPKKNVQSRRGDGGKRVQLFGSSPGDGVEDIIKDTPSSVFSPNISMDSPGAGAWKTSQTPSSSDRSAKFRGHRTPGSRGHTPQDNSSQRQSPHCGSRQSGSTDNHSHRTKQRFSLGEFIVSPDVDNTVSSKKNSPYSAGRREQSFDNSPSPLTGRMSGGKKRQSANRADLMKLSPAPVFSLNSISDFPPMGGDSKFDEDSQSKNEGTITRGKDSVFCSPYMKDSPNFEAKCRGVGKPSVITKSRRISFTTLPAEDSPDCCQTPSRRIKPTPIQGSKSWHHNKVFIDSTDNSTVTEFRSAEEASTEKNRLLSKERELLRQEKAKRLNQGLSSFAAPRSLTPTKFPERSNSVLEISVADRSAVTYEDKIDILAELYSSCLTDNLFPNMAVELYFVIQLLTSRSADLELVSNTLGLDTVDTDFFCTVHNAVYFAVKVLESQISLLRYLDRSTLRLLSENQRIGSFSETLTNWLTLEHGMGPKTAPALPKSPIGGVSFQAETDNRKNFPNDSSFHLFKKQRDTFYELLREWETSHMTPGWSVVSCLGDKIRSLINFKTELANHVHFARLFQSQLISMCKGDGSLKTEGEDENDALLCHLKRTNPEKFKRLQERFIMPLSVGGPCPVPCFPGCQEFFRDFIMAASSPVFNQHLTDTFAAKVYELNNISFAPESEETQTDQDGSDDEEKDRFVTSLMTVRLVGKFFGFVTFLPYQTSCRIPDEIGAMYMSLRRKHSMQIDLAGCLKTAYKLGHLTLTVPWVVEFLSMMDQVAPSLEILQFILFVLLYIHQKTWQRWKSSDICYADLLTVTTISWLFENTVIPEGFFFLEIPEDVVMFMSSVDSQADSGLDSMGLVDQKLYYTCCPYMGEIRTLLIEFSIGSSSKNSTIRKITPISADDRTQPSVSERQTQLHLEENFFHNHPASLKRTVDFVADRTASNYIKRFRSTLLLTSIGESKTRLSSTMEAQAGGSPVAKAKDKLQSLLLKISQEFVQQVKSVSATEVKSYCQKKIEAALVLLLPDEQSQMVVDMATKICFRITLEKVQQWISKHITTAMFQCELQTEMDRILKSWMLTQQKQGDVLDTSEHGSSLVTSVEGCIPLVAEKHDDSVPSPSDVLIELKQVVKDIAFGHIQHERASVISMICKVKKVINNRQDVMSGMYTAFGQLLMDLCLALVKQFPTAWSLEELGEFTSLWKGNFKKFTSFQDFLSPRVVYQMNQSNQIQNTWSVYTSILIWILEEELVSPEQFQQMYMRTLQAMQDNIECVGICLCDVADYFKTKEMCSYNFVDALEWIYQLAGDNSSLSQQASKLMNSLKWKQEGDKLQTVYEGKELESDVIQDQESETELPIQGDNLTSLIQSRTECVLTKDMKVIHKHKSIHVKTVQNYSNRTDST